MPLTWEPSGSIVLSSLLEEANLVENYGPEKLKNGSTNLVYHKLNRASNLARTKDRQEDGENCAWRLNALSRSLVVFCFAFVCW